MKWLRGGVGFLTRLPVSTDETDWLGFAATPVTFPLVGYLVGALAALAFLLPGVVAAFGYLVAVYALTGVNHADGLADLGDAAVVHGDVERRRAVLSDSAVGVGAVLALALGLIGLALAGVGLAGARSGVAVTLVVASEVGAKLGMATLACLGTAGHEGFGSTFTERCAPEDLTAVVLAAMPAALLPVTADAPAVGVAAVLAAVTVALWLREWATSRLGGVTGDVFGAANELGRVAGLHAGLLVLAV